MLSRTGQGCRVKAHWALLPACLWFAQKLEEADSSANSGVQIPVWFCQHDAQKQHVSLDAGYAAASTKAREEKVADNLGP